MDYPTNITNAAHRAQYDDIYRAAVEQVIAAVQRVFRQEFEIDVEAIISPVDPLRVWYTSVTFSWQGAKTGVWYGATVSIYESQIENGYDDLIENTLAAVARRLDPH